MKIKTLALGALLATLGMQAQVNISPVPQSVKLDGGEAFATVGTTYRLTGAADADADAVAALNETLTVTDGGAVEIILGEAGDAAVAAWEAQIPEKAEGYLLVTEPGRVVIAGRDGNGTFYGVQSLIQLAEQEQVPAATIVDYPTMSLRGVIEGFYGNPWSHQNRLDQFDFYGRNKMNVYVYGPKNDPYHHSRWYDPYPEAEAAQMIELAQRAAKNKVKFTWAMHPSNSIETDADRQKALEKFQQMYDMGVRSFAIFFDDIAAKSVNTQVEYLNFLTDNFVKTHEGVEPITVCPTHYNSAFAGWNPDTYLKPLGAGLYPEIGVMWTGAGVCSWINPATCNWFTDATGRKPFIWLNYPVNDYGGQSLLMGPFKGNDPAVKDMVTAFCSNPMEFAEASKVALYSLADFTWNTDNYDADEAWLRSLPALMPEHTDAFKTLCLNNVDYYQSTHGLRQDGETPDFKAVQDAHPTLSDEAIAGYRTFFNKQVAAANELLAVADDNKLLSEIKMWIQALQLQGTRGLALADMYDALNSGNAEAFIAAYTAYATATEEAESLICRDFEGSIKKFKVTTGMAFVEPFIKSTIGDFIADFKASGADYPEGLFPEQVLENGNYYIKWNGRWMSNGSGVASDTPGKPSFKADQDNVNPNRQIWQVRYDATTGRYSLRSLHDDRYVNEIGNFGTNPYSNAWNTYDIKELNGKYSIQNGGSGGNSFWKAANSGVSKNESNEYSPANFIFEFIPVDSELQPTSAISFPGEFLILDEQGLALTRQTSKNNPVFKAVSDPVKKTQIFKIAEDSATGRFSIICTQGNKYLNEKAVFGTNPYEAAWHTFKLFTHKGKFAIQNGGDGGNNWWTIIDDGVGTTTFDDPMAAYQFTIVPYVDESAIDAIVAEGDAANRVYDLQGREVKNPRRGLYIVNGKKTILK